MYIDTCIEALVVRGAIQMSRFLQGEASDSFSWVYSANDHDPNRSDSDDEMDNNHILYAVEDIETGKRIVPPNGGNNTALITSGSGKSSKKYAGRSKKRGIWRLFSWRIIGWSLCSYAGYWYLTRYHPTIFPALQEKMMSILAQYPAVSNAVSTVHAQGTEWILIFQKQLLTVLDAMKSIMNTQIKIISSKK